MAFNSFPINTENVDNNPFPKVILVEQGSAPSAPAAGTQKVYLDSTTHQLTREDSGSAVRDVEAIQATLSEDPASPVNGTWWLRDDGGSPASIALRFRKGGVTYTLAEVTL